MLYIHGLGFAINIEGVDVDYLHVTTISSWMPLSQRSRAGCKTCRKRRIRCDQRKPSCLICESNGRDCGGYELLVKLQSGHRGRQTHVQMRSKIKKVLLPIPPLTPDDSSQHDMFSVEHNMVPSPRTSSFFNMIDFRLLSFFFKHNQPKTPEISKKL